VSSNLIARSSLVQRYQSLERRPPGRLLLPRLVSGNRGSRGEAVGAENRCAATQRKRSIPAVFRQNRLQLTEPAHENLSFCFDDRPQHGTVTLISWPTKAWCQEVAQCTDPCGLSPIAASELNSGAASSAPRRSLAQWLSWQSFGCFRVSALPPV
jgi:hypothetical protein